MYQRSGYNHKAHINKINNFKLSSMNKQQKQGKKLTKKEIAMGLDASDMLYNFMGKGLTHYTNYTRKELLSLLNTKLKTEFK